MAAKFFTGLPLDGPDPECVQGYGEAALAGARRRAQAGQDHSTHPPGGASRCRSIATPLRPRAAGHACAESPLAGFSDG